MTRKQIAKKVRREVSARMNRLLAEGKDGGEIDCPNFPDEHKARIILLRSGKTATICPECGYEDVR